jgi:COX assembly protein 1
MSTTNQGDSSKYTYESITKREEEAIRKIMRESAREQCAELVKNFIECARGRTISVAWKCRTENKLMTKCLIHHTREEELERRKMQYWEEKMKRSPLTFLVPEVERDLEEGLSSKKKTKA